MLLSIFPYCFENKLHSNQYIQFFSMVQWTTEDLFRLEKTSTTSSPTIKSAPPYLAEIHKPKCHIHTPSEHGWRFHHRPGQPVPVPEHPVVSPPCQWIKLSKYQTKPPLINLVFPPVPPLVTWTNRLILTLLQPNIQGVIESNWNLSFKDIKTFDTVYEDKADDSQRRTLFYWLTAMC